MLMEKLVQELQNYHFEFPGEIHLNYEVRINGVYQIWRYLWNCCKPGKPIIFTNRSNQITREQRQRLGIGYHYIGGELLSGRDGIALHYNGKILAYSLKNGHSESLYQTTCPWGQAYKAYQDVVVVNSKWKARIINKMLNTPDRVTITYKTIHYRYVGGTIVSSSDKRLNVKRLMYLQRIVGKDLARLIMFHVVWEINPKRVIAKAPSSLLNSGNCLWDKQLLSYPLELIRGEHFELLDKLVHKYGLSFKKLGNQTISKLWNNKELNILAQFIKLAKFTPLEIITYFSGYRQLEFILDYKLVTMDDLLHYQHVFPTVDRFIRKFNRYRLKPKQHKF